MWKSLSHVQPHNPMDYTIHGILQARILEWVAFLFSRRSSQARDRTQVFRITGIFFTSWATREAQWTAREFPTLIFSLPCLHLRVIYICSNWSYLTEVWFWPRLSVPGSSFVLHSAVTQPSTYTCWAFKKYLLDGWVDGKKDVKMVLLPTGGGD